MYKKQITWKRVIDEFARHGQVLEMALVKDPSEKRRGKLVRLRDVEGIIHIDLSNWEIFNAALNFWAVEVSDHNIQFNGELTDVFLRPDNHLVFEVPLAVSFVLHPQGCEHE